MPLSQSLFGFPFRSVGRLVPLAVLLAITLPAFAQNNPKPLIYAPLVPVSALPGSAGFVLTVSGSGFVSGATVNWNRIPLPTTFVSAAKLTATVPAADLVTAGQPQVTVVNPTPGGGESNVDTFEVVSPIFPVFLATAELVPPQGDYMAVDFNHDGKLDLIAGSQSNSNLVVTIQLGNGDGTFQPAISYPTGVDPSVGGIGDYNNDGNLDFVVYNGFSHSVQLFLGAGNGTFTPGITIATDSAPNRSTPADYNRDGNLDLLVNTASGPKSVYLGNGDGTFQPPITMPHTGDPISQVNGDFNHDGVIDFATLDQNATTQADIYLGNGDGTFQPPTAYPLSSAFPSTTVADYNGDGNLDLAFSDLNPEVSVMLGNADGTFQAEQTYPSLINQNSIKTADIDGDGKLDLVSVSYTDGIAVLLGNGDGTFQSPLPFAYPFPTLYTVGIGDFNGDGKSDMVGTTGLVLLAGPVVGFYLSPQTTAFRPQLVGTTSRPSTLTLSNPGNLPLTISSISTGLPFAQTNTCGSGLAAGASCTISVTFTPTTDGSATGQVTVVDNALASPQSVSLTGTGTYVTLLPQVVSFGTVVIGNSSSRTVTLTNTAGSTLTISSVRITPTHFTQTNTCGSSVPPGGSCTFTVTYTPTAREVDTGKMAVFDSSGGSQSVSLQGKGTH